MMIAVGMLVG